jgi:hypothetical protein
MVVPKSLFPSQISQRRTLFTSLQGKVSAQELVRQQEMVQPPVLESVRVREMLQPPALESVRVREMLQPPALESIQVPELDLFPMSVMVPQ